ncbi:hypothetical protein Moror_6468 [Moniliophthora roreri MCA 2997]|uniref:B-related factor 1 n=2 Tax=Moniliophthora roreri TaxID=221103 RepID=V2XWF3_MONRO|nr:hypothetical protein Moror_6468 [Moniliophthora roreri MCA 2997]KAI3610649.1 hypothetical protein WG66_007065 [Moniliophthora roreri]
MSSCPQCSSDSLTSLDGASVCTNCGSVLDLDQSFIDIEAPSQNVQVQQEPSILKSLRGTSNWSLPGQSKEASQRRNTYLINELIKSLAHALHVPGLTLRATTLCGQAMATGQFRWGTRAKMVAGACLSIALRESQRPDSLPDIAVLVDQSLPNLKRVLASVLSALGISLIPSEPHQHLSTLQSHLLSILENPSCHAELPYSLVGQLKALSIRSAAETARALSNLLGRAYLSEGTTLRLSPAPAACAVLILSIEAEARATLSNVSELAACFAGRCHIGKGIVMRCYKSIQDELAKWIEELNWLDTYERSSRGRAKVAKRLLVARALKDLINWKDDIWKKRLKTSDCFSVGTEIDALGEPGTVEGTIPFSTSQSESISSALSEGDSRPRKRRRINHVIGDAARFLADPLMGPIPSRDHFTPVNDPASSSYSLQDPQPSSDITYHLFPLTQYLLAAPVQVRSITQLPTRLQLLTVARGGSGPDSVRDDELFVDGEWEAMQRSPSEVEEVLTKWRVDGILDSIEKAAQSQVNKPGIEKSSKYRKRKPNKCEGDGEERRKMLSKRINLDAFKAFMNDEEPESAEFLGVDDSVLGAEEYSEDEEDSEAEGIDGASDVDASRTLHCDTENGDVIDEWRPLSP